MLLEGKRVIITGASSGIGLETAKLFVKEGAVVCGTKNRHDLPDSDGIRYYHLDITSHSHCEKVINKMIADMGGVDILVNDAGITADATTRKMTEEQFDRVIAVNLKGMWNVTRIVGPYMQQNGGGSIINFSSIVGEAGNFGQANYAATKAGVIGMTKSWAREFAAKGGNVRVNAIAPGYTKTNMLATVPQDLLDRFAGQTMLGRLAEPSEVANVALFLASDMSSYITSSVIDVNGGMRL